MARRIWQGDFAQFWFGFRSSRIGRPMVDGAHAENTVGLPEGGALQTPDRPLGIVARNRLARQGRWALRSDGTKN